jgi:HKD family nuclease
MPKLIISPPVPLIQLTGGKTRLAERLNKLLAETDLKRFRVAVAYVRWSGLGILANRLEAFLKTGGEFQAIYGIENGVTSPDSLLYSLYLKKLYKCHSFAATVKDQYQNATFHPKFFEFQFEKKRVALIGSNNLTAGGLVNNIELLMQAEFAADDPLVAELDGAWQAFAALAEPISLEKIRQLKDQKKLGSELDREPGTAGAKPYVNVGVKTAKKPLFLKFLDVKSVPVKKALITNLDVITEKPKKLYLQILKYETGGSKAGGDAGYQVQLPVATLSAFFGVPPDKTQNVSFHFGPELIEVSLTHFGNNTHRIRLKPIQKIKRPAIVVFERTGNNEYKCSVVPANRYRSVLAAKCTQQTRAGARRWGIS